MRTAPRGPKPRFPESEYPDQALTGLIIASAYEVHRAFGFGFLEAVYKRALVIELRHREVRVEREVPYDLFHRGEPVGPYRADILVESRVIVEVKTGLVADPGACSQLLNYLRAANLPLGLVIHFGHHVNIERVIADTR